MKKVIFLIFVSLISIHLYSQTVFTEDMKLESLCKVWGFLKYYHPGIMKGKIDWDQQLIKHIPMVISAKDKQKLCNLYISWIDSLGRVKTSKHSREDAIPNTLNKNLDIRWIEDHDQLSDSLVVRLERIRDHRTCRINYNAKQNALPSISFENKQMYPGLDFPDKEYRLLSLFRFWNVINYYYPYKYLIDEKWDHVLTGMIDRFKNAKDTVEYHLALSALTAIINDTHTGLVTNYVFQYLGYYWVPFKIKIFEDKAVVTKFYSDSLSDLDHIKRGDVILKVNGKLISDVIAEKSPYFSGSNIPARLSKISDYLLNGHTDSIWITFDRDGKQYTSIIHRYKFSELHLNATNFQDLQTDTNALSCILDNHFGYINMGKLQPGDVHKVMIKMKGLDAIIFDIRNYPNKTVWKISKYLDTDKKAIGVSAYPSKGNPGIFEYQKPQYTNRRSSDYFKGKVVILVNESTICHAEYSCMILQTVNHSIIIGSQTAGAVGTGANFSFPGGYKTIFTGVGFFYPDGREVQRTGVVPDINVTQTIEGIRKGKDEILERAVEFLKNGK
jgi:carboxyl-terminal processing protease